MSKYKVGDKFIIEINDVITDTVQGGCYKFKAFPYCLFGRNLDELEKVGILENTASDKISVPDDWEENGIRSKTTGLIVAPENYEEGSKKHFTWDEAMEVEKRLKGTGWRLPTVQEWCLLTYEFGWREERNDLDAETLKENLKLSFAGYFGGGSLDGTGYGNYWSRTAFSADNAYYLYYYSGGVYPQYNGNKGYGHAVRLVKEVACEN